MKQQYLGNKECDYETGYFLEHGKYPPQERCKCTFAPTEDPDWEQLYVPKEYYCWQGRRIPQWFE